MRSSPLTLVVVCALVLAAASFPIGAQSDGPADATARVIVKYKADSTLLRKQALSATAQHFAQAQALSARVGLALSAGSGVSDRSHVLFASGMTSEQLAQRLAAERDIEYAVPDRRRRRVSAPNDPFYLAGPPIVGTTGGPPSGQWYLRAPAGEVRSSLDVEPAWAVTTGNPNIVVGVIDTGVRFDHPDLQRVAAGGNLLPGYDMISDTNTANDGDGRDPDPSDPGDWVTQAEISQRNSPFFQCVPSPENSSWHGTQTSGLVGALTNNGIGMASVGRNVRVLPVRVLGKCGGFDSDIIAGMRWAAGLAVPGAPANPTPARVLNLSLGGVGACSAAYVNAVTDINAAGVVIVAAAGNRSGHAAFEPANCSGVIGVAGLRHVGTKVGFSNIGPEVSISAPGGNCVNTTSGLPCLYPILTTANSGLTTPNSDTGGGSIYTDSFKFSLGTSFSAPLVAGTAALMLSAQPNLTPAQVRVLMQVTARAFPTTGGDNGDGTPVLQCVAPQPPGAVQTDQSQCYCTTATCGAGMLDAGKAVLAAQATDTPNFTGLFYKAPAESESGWGINVAHQGDIIFATWFTYDLTGKGWWLSMTATKTGNGTYSGTLFETRGPAFSAVPFNPSTVTRTAVGSGTLTFSDVNNGTFVYSVNGIQQSKAITRQVFGTLPSCTFAGQLNLTLATNYQDLWYAAPAESEAGWGVNFTHQGNTIFVTWFTYDTDGSPLWLSATATKSGLDTYSGTLFRSTGPAFNAVPFNPALVDRTPVGTLSITFGNGNSATYTYSVTLGPPGSTVTQSKQITRQVFRAPGTVCL